MANRLSCDFSATGFDGAPTKTQHMLETIARVDQIRAINPIKPIIHQTYPNLADAQYQKEVEHVGRGAYSYHVKSNWRASRKLQKK